MARSVPPPGTPRDWHASRVQGGHGSWYNGKFIETQYTNVTGSFAVATDLAFTALAADDILRVVSDNAADTAASGIYATLEYISTTQKRVIVVKGLDGTTEVDFNTGDDCAYFDQFYISSTAAGNVTLERDNGTDVTILATTNHNTDIAHGFAFNTNGPAYAYITYWEFFIDDPDADGSVDVECQLRIYPNASGARTITNPFITRSGLKTFKTDGLLGYAHPKDAGHIVIPPGAYFSLQASGNTGDIKTSLSYYVDTTS